MIVQEALGSVPCALCKDKIRYGATEVLLRDRHYHPNCAFQALKEDPQDVSRTRPDTRQELLDKRTRPLDTGYLSGYLRAAEDAMRRRLQDLD